MTKDDFRKRIQKMDKRIWSKTRSASYTNFVLIGDELSFERVNTSKNCAINLDQLFDVYMTHAFINTSVIKNATGGKVNSPSAPVLMAVGCIDPNGNKVR